LLLGVLLGQHRLPDGILQRLDFVPLLSPIKRLPLKEKSGLQDILWQKAYIGQRQISEVRAEIGDVLGALTAHFNLRFLCLEARLPNLRALAQRLLTRGRDIDFGVGRQGLHFYRKLGVQIPAE